MLKPGLQATVEETVTGAMTAEGLGSGDLPVLGTPAVLALVEAAAVAAVDVALDASATTVGASVKLDHVAPTAVGRSVTATAALVEVDGRRLRFRFEVTDEAGPVAHGEHARVIVDRERFLRDARERG